MMSGGCFQKEREAKGGFFNGERCSKAEVPCRDLLSQLQGRESLALAKPEKTMQPFHTGEGTEGREAAERKS